MVKTAFVGCIVALSALKINRFPQEVARKICADKQRIMLMQWSREIDTIIKLPDKELYVSEIKLRVNEIGTGVEKLISIQNGMMAEGSKLPAILCAICGLSNAACQKQDGMFVVPMTALKA